ncbi:MAG: hypothetical protein R2939_03495 [Kofleriaceae bacterium]
MGTTLRHTLAPMALAVTLILAGLASTSVAQPDTGAPATGAPDPTAAPADPAAPTAMPAPTPVVEDSPVAVRLRALEQRVQALKERAWRQKARVGMLRESALGGGTGAMATIAHTNKMGSSFRLIKLVYTLDGTQVFARSDDTAASLYKTKSLDIFNGPIGPGSHTLAVVATYRGHGYGVFKYLSKYTYQAKESYSFSIEEGKATRVEVIGYEKGGSTTPMEKRPSIEFKVTSSEVKDGATPMAKTAPAASASAKPATP